MLQDFKGLENCSNIRKTPSELHTVCVGRREPNREALKGRNGMKIFRKHININNENP